MSEPLTEPPPPDVRFELLVNSSGKSRAVPLPVGRPASVGRGDENLIRLDYPSVSRLHLQLHPGVEGVEVEDLGSSNGTVLIRGTSDLGGSSEPIVPAPQRLNPHERLPLQVGDALRIGPALISLQMRRRASHSSVRAVVEPPVLLDPALRKAYELAGRAAATDISVLILGETGVGKEAMAQAVHGRSPRHAGPFLLLNCAALSETLLESELFGHEKGAFTGAAGTKVGLLESTQGGTVFLDEVGELPLGTQAKLLRVLEERTVMRVGSTKPRPIDVRFVTATNRDLGREVRAGRFRGDLYYRIGGFVLQVPPLRERQVEIEPLARYFLREFCRRLGQPVLELTPSAITALHAHDWPGNVRELKNLIERAVLVAGTSPVTADHVTPDSVLREDPSSPDDFDDSTQRFQDPRIANGFGGERKRVESQTVKMSEEGSASSKPPASDAEERMRLIRTLELCGGNQTRAAGLLGISRRTLINRLERWKLPRPQKR
jgi:transcriptional regulator with PAS, ATPase and Fis domain